MSKTVQIASPAQFNELLKSSRIVVTDCMFTPPTPPANVDRGTSSDGDDQDDTDFETVYADWCGPCKQVAPVYEQLASSLSRPNQITFSKVNTETQKEIASKYGITA